jgi:hypothetical protein
MAEWIIFPLFFFKRCLVYVGLAYAVYAVLAVAPERERDIRGGGRVTRDNDYGIVKSLAGSSPVSDDEACRLVVLATPVSAGS